MALNLTTQYPGKIDTTDANYPYGKAQNITTPGDGTGTPWEAALLNDVFGFQQALLKSAGIVPSGAADKVTASQYLQALTEIGSGRGSHYIVSGTANAITLTAFANQESPQSLYIGLSGYFIATSNNTGAVTIDQAGLGVKSVKKFKTAALVADDIKINKLYKVTYDGVNYIISGNNASLNEITDSGNYYTSTNTEDALQELKPSAGGVTGTFEGSTTPGTGWVYFTQIGRWTRIGKLLYIDMRIATTPGGGGISGDAAGSLYVAGFPTTFTSGIETGAVIFSGFTLGGGYTNIVVEPLGGGRVYFWKTDPTGGVMAQLQVSDITGIDIELRFSLVMEVA